MKSFSFTLLGSLIFSLASALNVTYPTDGARIDRSKTFNITWTPGDADANDTIDIIASYPAVQNFIQYVAFNVSVSDLKHDVPPYTLDTVGEALFIFNTIGSESNRFVGESALVYILAGSGEQNATQTVGPTGSTTTTSAAPTSTSSGSASNINLEDGLSLLAWLSVVGIGALF